MITLALGLILAGVPSPPLAELLHVSLASVPGDGFGLSAQRIPDLDADGVDDLAVGAPVLGRVHLVSGARGLLLGTLRGAPGFGALLALADVDGDGIDDLLAGPVAGDRSLAQAFSGKSGALISLVKAPWTLSALEWGSSAGEGRSVLLGDLDGDGVADYACRDLFAPGPGLVECFSGRSGARLFDLESGQLRDAFGWSLGDAGDVDGDGHADVIVGAPGDDQHGRDAGAAWVHSGATGEPLLVILGDLPGQRLGTLVGSMGDADGDGLCEVWVTAWEGADCGPGLGTLRVYCGRSVFSTTSVDALR